MSSSAATESSNETARAKPSAATAAAGERQQLVIYFVKLGMDLYQKRIDVLSENARAKGAIVLDHLEAPPAQSNTKKKRKKRRKWPTTTTMSQQQQQKVEKNPEQTEGKEKSSHNMIVPTHLVIGETCGAKQVAEHLKFSSVKCFEQYLITNNTLCATPKWIVDAAAAVDGTLSGNLRMDQRWWKIDLTRKKRSLSSSNPKEVSSNGEEKQSDNEGDDVSDNNNKGTTRNLALSKALLELSKLHQKMPLSGEDRWKSYMFNVIGHRVRHLDFEITLEDESQKRLSTIKGIGKKTREKIVQFLRDGQIERVQEFYRDPNRIAMSNLMKIWGVGPSKALELKNKGCATIHDVRAKLEANEIVLDRNQQIGVECYEDFLEEMTRDEVETIGSIIIEAVRKQFPERDREKLEITIMGSYRRGKLSCGDVDLLITHKDYYETVPSQALGEVVEDLLDQGHITHHLTFISGMRMREQYEVNAGGYNRSKGAPATEKADRYSGSSYMGVFNSPMHPGKRRRVDVKFYPYRERVFASLYFTGNGYFNRSMRLWASRKRNLQLSDHGLFDRDTETRVMDATTERQVFDYLGLCWKEPHERLSFDAVMGTDGSIELEGMKQRDFEREESKHTWVD